jgi:hypothetical protein
MAPKPPVPSGDITLASRKNGTNNNPKSRYITARNFAVCPIENRLICC